MTKYAKENYGEAEEAIPLDALADEKLVLKKDAEELGDLQTGKIWTYCKPYKIR
ncbi:unnamed protein product [Cylicostephanus goldi]|uniref:Uncharacterized protein n=1 Tax=Cylicostephanus goldi TaxID=71465 RepID=A0A3P7MG19_CYLGO|nr:unnamed protein product [Cylicostephanus goldi]